MAPLRRDAFEISALAERVHRIGGKTSGLRPLGDSGTDVGRKGVLETGFRVDQRTRRLANREPLMIDEGGLGKQLQRGGHGLDHRLDLALEIVALVDHVGDIGAPACLPFEVQDFMKDAEDAIGIDGAQG